MNNKITVSKQQLEKWEAKGIRAIVRGATLPIQVGKVTVPKPKMNKTESSYANLLEVLKRNGEIFHYGFEEVTLKLGNDTRFTPDFFVARKDELGFLFEFHETKGGFIRDDSRVKFQCARKQFPFFKFKMMQLVKGSWSEIYPE